MIRVAATGDVHFGADSAGTLRPHLEQLPGRADVFLIAGDLTRSGSPAEAMVLAAELSGLDIPTIAVLGNHDYEVEEEARVRNIMESAGVRVLDNENHVVEAGNVRIGITGVKGFGGGFAGACGSDFGEPEMKAFIRHTKDVSGMLEALLRSQDADVHVALLHYAPVEETLRGERLEIYPFLGSYLLAEAIDTAGTDLVLHGHAHNGVEKGVTPGGIPVRNVAQPVIKYAYTVYALEASEQEERRLVVA